MPNPACCALRADEYAHTSVTEMSELAPLLVDVSLPGSAHRSLRCRVCGQAWEQYRIPEGDGNAFRVMKVGAAAAVSLAPAPRLPLPSTKLETLARRSFGPLGGFGVLLIGAGLFFALWRLPIFTTGKAAPWGWVARWIVGGLLAALAVQTVVALAGSRRGARRR